MIRQIIYALVVPVILSLSISAVAAGQETKITLTETGFTNKDIVAAMQTTDALASPNTCAIGNSNPCVATENQTFYPKNMGNVLCTPNTLNATLTPNCQALLNTGADKENCGPNPLANYCSSSTRGFATACYWRTSNNKSTSGIVNWTVIKSASGVYEVDCNQSGYTMPSTAD